MRKTQAPEIVSALERAGISHVFGIPGTHNIELYDALADSRQITTVLITDEQSAGFLADGYARASGRMAAICLVPGAGLSHALSGIAEAYLDQVPILVIACGVRSDLPRRFQLHDVDQLSMVRPICKWAGTVTEWSRLGDTLESAVRLAQRAPAGPVVVEIPSEGFVLSDPPMSFPQILPKTPRLRPFDELNWAMLRAFLGGAKQVGLYVANIGGSLAEQEKLVQLANRLNAWVWTTISAKGLYPENDDRFLWNVAGTASPPSIQALESEVDLWIMLGGKFGEVPTGSYGFEPRGCVVHVDLSPEAHSENLREDLTLECDAWVVVDRLLSENITAGEATSKEKACLARARARAEVLDKDKPDPGNLPMRFERIAPAAFFRALQKVLPPDTVYSVDSGNGLFLAMEHLELSRPRCFLAPVDFSCMGYSVPAAVGARLGSPSRTVVSLPGDAAFLMTGLELLTGIRNGAAPIVIVLRDGKLSQIAQFQQRGLGRETASALAPYEVSKLAEAVGARHYAMKDAASLDAVLQKILAESKEGVPILAEVLIDYSKPTFFTRGVVRSTFDRLPAEDRIAALGRLYGRKLKNWFVGEESGAPK